MKERRKQGKGERKGEGEARGAQHSIPVHEQPLAVAQYLPLSLFPCVIAHQHHSALIQSFIATQGIDGLGGVEKVEREREREREREYRERGSKIEKVT
jgi:hypothetical protein